MKQIRSKHTNPASCNAHSLKRVKGVFRRFGRNSNGVVAVEFAMVAMPFILMLTMIFDVSITYFARKTLDLAVDNVSRQIRTGELTVAVPSDPSDPAAQEAVERAALELFTQKLCKQPYMQTLFNCSPDANTFIVDVQTVASWADAPGNAEEDEELGIDDEGNETVEETVDDSGFGFKPGGRLSINVVRVFYEWPSIVPLKIARSADDGWIGRNLLLSSSSAFMTEPF